MRPVGYNNGDCVDVARGRARERYTLLGLRSVKWRMLVMGQHIGISVVCALLLTMSSSLPTVMVKSSSVGVCREVHDGGSVMPYAGDGEEVDVRC